MKAGDAKKRLPAPKAPAGKRLAGMAGGNAPPAAPAPPAGDDKAGAPPQLRPGASRRLAGLRR